MIKQILLLINGFPDVLELIPGYSIYAALFELDLPAPEDYSRAGPSGYPANLTKANKGSVNILIHDLIHKNKTMIYVNKLSDNLLQTGHSSALFRSSAKTKLACTCRP